MCIKTIVQHLKNFLQKTVPSKLLIEIFKVKMKLAPEIMNEVFDIIESPYPLRNESRFKSQNIRTVRYGIETAAFVGSRIWSYMPSELNKSMSLNKFRSKITWKPENCLCKLCKIYLQRIGYRLFAHRYCYICLFVCLLVLPGGGFCLFLFLFCILLSPPLNFLTPSLKLT